MKSSLMRIEASPPGLTPTLGANLYMFIPKKTSNNEA